MQLIPNAKQQFIDQNGLPLASGTVGFYFPGTLNPKPTYQDAAGTIANTNPVTLDSRGQALIWGSGVYRQIVKDGSGVTIWDQVTEDSNAGLTGNITDAKFVSGVDFMPGTTTQLTLPVAPASAANMWAFFDAGYQADDQYSVNGTTLTFNSPIPVGVQEVNVKIGTTIAIGTPGSGTVTDASVASGTKLSNRLKDFYDLRDFGAKCDGTTDDTTAVQFAITAVGSIGCSLIIPGPTLISGALTFSPNTQLFPLNGGYLIGKAGTELVQLQSAPLAGPVKLLVNMAARATNGMTVYPEWFGAAADGVTDDSKAIQRAIDFLQNTGGIVQFEARTYIIGTLVQIGNGVGGTGQNTVLQGKGRHSTVIKTTGATQSAIQVIGDHTSTLQGCAIRNLSIDKTVTSTGGVGITAQYTAILEISDVQINNHLLGVSLLGAGNTMCSLVIVTFSGSTPNFRGFDINGGGSNVGGSKSSIFRDCYVEGINYSGANGIGFLAYGAYVSDLVFYGCATGSLTIGFEFDMTTSANTGNEDVQLINCVADGCLTYGVFVNGAGGSGSADSMLTILGGWFDMGNVLTQVNLIYLNGCQGVVIEGAQIYNAPAEPNSYGVYMQNCQGCTILGNTFRELKYSVYSTGGRNNMVKGNNIFNAAATPGTQQAVMLGESYSSIQGNTFRGYATNGAVIDGASISCSMVDNIADPANITTRYTNSAGGTSFTANNIGA